MNRKLFALLALLALACGLLSDLAGILAAIAICYLFFG